MNEKVAEATKKVWPYLAVGELVALFFLWPRRKKR